MCLYHPVLHIVYEIGRADIIGQLFSINICMANIMNIEIKKDYNVITVNSEEMS